MPKSNRELPQSIEVSIYKTDIVDLPFEDDTNRLTTTILLHTIGDDNPYNDCIIEIIEGPDAGKLFLANFMKFQRLLEPFSAILLSVIEEE